MWLKTSVKIRKERHTSNNNKTIIKFNIAQSSKVQQSINFKVQSVSVSVGGMWQSMCVSSVA